MLCKKKTDSKINSWSISTDNVLGAEKTLISQSWKKKFVNMRYNNEDPKLFKIVFPDSKIASKFSLGRDKMTYLILYGITLIFHASSAGEKGHFLWFVRRVISQFHKQSCPEAEARYSNPFFWSRITKRANALLQLIISREAKSRRHSFWFEKWLNGTQCKTKYPFTRFFGQP